MNIIEDVLLKVQNKIVHRLKHWGKKRYNDPEYYDPKDTASVAMSYVQIHGKRGLSFDRKKMIRVHNGLKSVRNKADVVESILRDFED